MDNLNALMLRLWESACADSPQRPSCKVADGHFVLTIHGNQAQWVALCEAAHTPASAQQEVSGDTLTMRWPSYADEIFGEGGLIARKLGAAYEVRQSQLQMARLVQRAIEMRGPAVVEAGTGVGKSFAYAAICMAMNRKVCISTSNKALQMQLYRKDIPFLQQIFPNKTMALAVGKSNYACRFKVEDGLAGTLSIGSPDLRQWYLGTENGNTEEIPFAVDWKELSTITVDDDCGGKHCPFYGNCFYFDAKAERANVDVLITNHALLCLHTLYPGANILPPSDVLVVDEAHKLPDYARNALGFEVTLTSMARTIDLAEPFVEADDLQQAVTAFTLWKSELANWSASKIDADGRLPQQLDLTGATFDSGEPLTMRLALLAEAVWPEDQMPTDATERRQAKRAQKLLTLAERVKNISSPFDKLREQVGSLVRWMEPANDKLCAAPATVDVFISQLAGFSLTSDEPTVADHTRCSRCGRTLTANSVALLNGVPYGPDCIRKVDILGDAEYMHLADWLATQITRTKPEITTGQTTIFTSATLAAPDLKHFLSICGLPDALQMQASSPFDYANNALLYAPNGNSPAPNESTWSNWAVEQMGAMVNASKGGAFLLFTSNAMLKYAVGRLRSLFVSNGLTVLVQGELPKLEIANRFKSDGNAVLFATKSFFEGVSIDGNALRLVVIDKLPFEAPTPMSTAMEAAATQAARAANANERTIGNAGFERVRIPRMTIELKQACGRLIRTQTDRGVLAILDPRLRASQYGRRDVLPALPPAQLTSKLTDVELFFKEATK